MFTMKFLKMSTLMSTVGSICACWGHNKVQCTDDACPVGTNYYTATCRSWAVDNLWPIMDIFFGFNVGRCYFLSQMCEELDSVSAVVIYPGQLCLQMMTIRTEPVGKIKVLFQIYQVSNVIYELWFTFLRLSWWHGVFPSSRSQWRFFILGFWLVSCRR